MNYDCDYPGVLMIVIDLVMCDFLYVLWLSRSADDSQRPSSVWLFVCTVIVTILDYWWQSSSETGLSITSWVRVK